MKNTRTADLVVLFIVAIMLILAVRPKVPPIRAVDDNQFLILQ